MIQIQELQGGYSRVNILREITLEIGKGEVVALLGPNGAGKTTLMRTIAGDLPAQGGRIVYRGEEITRWPSWRRFHAGLALVPEGHVVFKQMTVLENLAVAGSRWKGQQERIRRNCERVFTLFPRLAERRAVLAGSLSGGEQQMLALGRALIAEPDLLLVDEPSLGLAPQVTDLVFDALRQLTREGISLLLVEQQVTRALELAHRGFILRNGRIVLSGVGAELLAHPDLVEQYIGWHGIA